MGITSGQATKGVAVQIYDPTAPAPVMNAGAMHRPDTLEGRSVAFLDNGWSALAIFRPEFERLLTRHHGVAEVSHELIPLATSAPTSQLRAIADRADFAVVALAN
jgi:hypothetical protein